MQRPDTVISVRALLRVTVILRMGILHKYFILNSDIYGNMVLYSCK
ncbi:hypothetical protein BACCAP_04773 [Pseudoflavonifractor capillosus ATCC 29799]|uniref:Uncharacterized protein n=1 Tax=Pseudoflavonifractor capillosus ATCC 29799 TaxID=411467 RepID=A6P2P1_9FIRM|nr:hypothetical protein BACCAP_04773 [Pseudoflavonifractor capillosus ATCC 29799]